ncbi:MAG: methyltransferase [Deltaproteobacteria bacterium]|nr:methyltransferase [Deltaproteobacteria bacterium]
MGGQFELVTLRNGHRAVRHVGHGEVMHPSVGPWAEANALYVTQAKLSERLSVPGAGPLRLYDVGLGAAANAAAALACWRALPEATRRPLHVDSFEVDLEPLRLALSDVGGFPFLAADRAVWMALLERGEHAEPGLSWRLHLGDALRALPRAEGPVEVIFHDPFSPESNPTLWSPAALAALRARGQEGGQGTVLFTYSASTRTRVSMLLGGFCVGVGDAIGTKQETTVAASRLDLLQRPLDGRFLQRFERSGARAPFGEAPAGWEDAVRSHLQFR